MQSREAGEFPGQRRKRRPGKRLGAMRRGVRLPRILGQMRRIVRDSSEVTQPGPTHTRGRTKRRLCLEEASQIIGLLPKSDPAGTREARK